MESTLPFVFLFRSHVRNLSFLGIDELLPAEDYCTVDIESAVKLRMKDIGPGSEPPITIPTLMEKTLQRFPNNAAMGQYCCG